MSYNAREYQAKWKRMKRYGATEEDLLRFDETTHCEICEIEFKGSDKCMDHCHTTMKVRGALCHKCNRTLGILENRDLDAFYKYIDKWKSMDLK